ncbi:putative protein N(5)-glutamine methyltransferase [soil metagenome]
MRRLRAIASNEGVLLALVEARLAGEPLQYLEGNVQFGPVEVLVDRRVLIPRPETENLFDLVSKAAVAPEVIVDLCTGSGALALAFKTVFPTARVIGADISPDALAVARSNGSEVEWLEGDLFFALGPDLRGEIDLLVANPPYVSEAEWDILPADVKREPRSALVAGPAGTEMVERILGELDSWLAPGGEAWIEIGEKQGWLAGEYPVEVVEDQYGVDRYLRWT